MTLTSNKLAIRWPGMLDDALQVGRFISMCAAGVCVFAILEKPAWADPPYEDWVVGYLHRLKTDDDSEDNVNKRGEMLVVITTSDGTHDRSIQYPPEGWESTTNGDRILEGYPDPFAGSKKAFNLKETGLPWGMPFFSLPIAELPDRLVLTISVLESDKPSSVAAGLINVVNIVTDGVTSFFTGNPIASGIGAGIEEVTNWVKDGWNGDIIGIHTNDLSKEDLNELIAEGRTVSAGGNPNEAVDGRMHLAYAFRKVRVPCGVRVRVKAGDIQTKDTDDGLLNTNGEIYMHSHFRSGVWDGSVVHDHYLRTPATGTLELPEGGSSRNPTWDPDLAQTVLTDNHDLGPFLSASFAVWDDDDTSANDLLGTIYGLWLTDDLVAGLNIETGRKVTYSVTRSEAAKLSRFKFSIELVKLGIDPKPLTISPAGSVTLNQSVNVCRKIRNNCDFDADLKLVFLVDGKQVGATRSVRITRGAEKQECFAHKFTNPEDNNKSHKLNIDEKNLVGRWKDASVHVSAPFAPF